ERRAPRCNNAWCGRTSRDGRNDSRCLSALGSTRPRESVDVRLEQDMRVQRLGVYGHDRALILVALELVELGPRLAQLRRLEDLNIDPRSVLSRDETRKTASGAPAGVHEIPAHT